MKKLFFITGLLFSLISYAQKKNTPPYFAASISADDMKKTFIHNSQ
ncbi:MAG: hypothetical protein WDO71_09595 [Bacteroidota bacterium]